MSPYLKPIEHSWDMLVRRMHAPEPPVQNMHQLEAALHKVWQQLSPQDIQCLTGGKRRRYETVIQARRSYSWYWTFNNKCHQVIHDWRFEREMTIWSCFLNWINGANYNRRNVCIIHQSIASPLQQNVWHHDWCRISRGQQYISNLCVGKYERKAKDKYDKRKPLRGWCTKILQWCNTNLQSVIVSKMILYFCQYLYKVSSAATTNHKGQLNKNYEPEGARLYSTGTHSCSVASSTKYIFKLYKECDALWQRPKDLFD
jgi:hypothetical protein